MPIFSFAALMAGEFDATVVQEPWITVAEKAGSNPTAQGFASALEKTTFPRDMFGGDEQAFTPTKHLGSNRAKLCQIQGGKWRSLTDYITE